jgi:hypothetical protein
MNLIHEVVASEGTADVERRTRVFSSFCRAALRTLAVREFWLGSKTVYLGDMPPPACSLVGGTDEKGS